MAKHYEEAFKKQIVALFNNGKSLADINREYGIAKSTIKTWVERHNESGSFSINDVRTAEEKRHFSNFPRQNSHNKSSKRFISDSQNRKLNQYKNRKRAD
jgi:transposase-like protein